MKKVFYLFLLMSALASGQVADDFESGNLSKWICPVAGRWKADAIAPLSGSYTMHHSFDNPVAGYDQAGISLRDIKPLSGTTTWSFKIRYGYAPSASNSWNVFLMSDAEPASMIPGGTVNGYAVGVNLSGYDDTLRLWKIKNGTVTKVLSSKVNWEKEIGTTSVASIKVERTATGDWIIGVVKGSALPGWTARGRDPELFSARWLGIYYKYTAACDRLLWMDDLKIDGVFYTDSIPPHPDTSLVTGKHKLVISFDEAPAFSRMRPSDFLLNPGGIIASDLKALSDRTLEVSFNESFTNKTENSIVINNLCDSSQNCISGVKVLFTPVWADIGDVIISEIMADPVTAVGLPPKEYIEITNTTAIPFNLKGWTMVSGSSIIYFSEKIIKGNEIMILCSAADTSAFKGFGTVTGLKSFPVLTDQGKVIIIKNEYGDLIHGVEYSSEWSGDVMKSEGGWSLEIEDTSAPFYYEGNWTASVSRSGGTPGSVNSVSRSNPDLSCPSMLNVFPEDSTSISVKFSEPVLVGQLLIPEIEINGIGIRSFIPTDPLFRSYIFETGQILATGISYELSLSGQVTDYEGNPFCVKEFVFGVPETLINGDIQFNELLFNPYPGAADYIEFYNCSYKVIDAALLQIISVNDETGDTSSYVALSGEHRCIMPYSYYVVTTSKKGVTDNYPSSDPVAVFEMEALVSMADDKGHIVLLNRELDVIDEVWYDEKMHFSLLADYEGVSLEKIRQSILSSAILNWHSASESSGWGTPGRSNSVFTVETENNDRVIFSSAKITPDNDGSEDFLVIDLWFENEGNVITVSVFDDSGYFVKELADNLSVGVNDSLVWDGTDKNGSLVSTGIYIILYSGFDETGKTIKWKKTCTVLRR